MNRKLTLVFCIFASFLAGGIGAQTINDWENPDVNGINKEKPHTYGFVLEYNN